jgi:hypothetical protein
MHKTCARNLRRIGVVCWEKNRDDCAREITARTLRVEAAKPPHTTRSEIDFEIRLIVRDKARLHSRIVICNQAVSGRRIRRGIHFRVRCQIRCHRIRDRNLVVSVRSEIVLRIEKLNRAARDSRVQQCGKISAEHRRREQAGCGAASFVSSDSFIIGEKEKLVFQDRPADRTPKNLLSVGILRKDGHVKFVTPAIGVEDLAFNEIVGRSVVAIGAGLQNRNHRAAVGISVSGIRVGRNDAQFRDRIGRGIVCDQVVLRFIIVGAFKRVVVRLLTVTIDRDDAVVKRISLDRVVASQPRRISVDGARLKECKRRKITAIQRDILDLSCSESVAQRGIGRVENRMGFSGHHRRFRRADLQADVHFRSLVDFNREGWHLGGGEAFSFHGQLVHANREEPDCIDAGVVGLRCRPHASGGVFRCNRGANYDRAARVVHHSSD